MALELVGGAVLGAAVSELLTAVIHTKNTLISFKPSLEQLDATLESVMNKVEEIKGIDQIEKKPEIRKLIMKLREGNTLVKKCSRVQPWNYYLQKRYSKDILELDNYLIRFFQLDVQAAIWSDVAQILGKVTHIYHKLDSLTRKRGTSSGSSISDGAGGVTIYGNGEIYLEAPVPIKPPKFPLETGHNIMGKIAHRTKVLAAGGHEKLFLQTFESVPEEQLQERFVCSLYTSAGPIKGTLYLSNAKLAFCSRSPLPYKKLAEPTLHLYYKVSVPLHMIKEVNHSFSKVKPDEKYIQAVTLNNYEFWFLDFVKYGNAVNMAMLLSASAMPC